MEMNSSDFLFNVELESGLNEMLDTCLGYVADVLAEDQFTRIEDQFSEEFISMDLLK